MEAKAKREGRMRRHARVRKKVEGTASRPRLAVYRSNRHIYAQLIDDVAAATLAAASDTEIASGPAKTDRAKEAGIERVVFDRGGRKFHGRVAAVADGAREEGLQI